MFIAIEGTKVGMMEEEGTGGGRRRGEDLRERDHPPRVPIALSYLVCQLSGDVF